MASFNNLTKALGGIAGEIKAKAADAASEALHVKDRVKQHALEAAGMTEKPSDDDDIPELAYATLRPIAHPQPGAMPLVAVAAAPWVR